MNIIRLKTIRTIVKPYTATVVGGVFDMFNYDQLIFLKKCSFVGRPLIVIVQADKSAKIRSGFNRPLVKQKQRAEIVASLECVDFVLVLEKPSDYEKYLRIIKPKYFIYPTGIMKYRRYGEYLINRNFPKITTIFVKSNLYQIDKEYLQEGRQTERDYSKINNLIIKRLYYIADKSSAMVGKISALITFQDKIIAESDNDETKDMHAEHIVINKAKSIGIDFSKIKLYTLIPPCILCAQVIAANNITQVHYLHPYGNDDGLKYLRKNKIRIVKIIQQ